MGERTACLEVSRGQEDKGRREKSIEALNQKEESNQGVFIASREDSSGWRRIETGQHPMRQTLVMTADEPRPGGKLAAPG